MCGGKNHWNKSELLKKLIKIGLELFACHWNRHKGSNICISLFANTSKVCQLHYVLSFLFYFAAIAGGITNAGKIDPHLTKGICGNVVGIFFFANLQQYPPNVFLKPFLLNTERWNVMTKSGNSSLLPVRKHQQWSISFTYKE